MVIRLYMMLYGMDIFEAVKVLGEAKARLDLTGYDGNTPEQLAIQNGYTEIARFLKMASN